MWITAEIPSSVLIVAPRAQKSAIEHGILITKGLIRSIIIVQFMHVSKSQILDALLLKRSVIYDNRKVVHVQLAPS